MQIPLQPKAIHDEMNPSAFDEFGRMTANLGLEAVPATPALQNVILYPYVNPATELIDATNLPKGDVNVTPICLGGRRDPDLEDHPQRGGHAPDPLPPVRRAGAQPGHLGQHHHPARRHRARLEGHRAGQPARGHDRGPAADHPDAAVRAAQQHPAAEPDDAARVDTIGFNNIDAAGNPTAPIVNQLVNFGWEYVYHCHILSHEEMDMMRPVSVALPPNAPDGLAYTVTGNGNNTVLTLTWNDNSINETSFVVQRRRRDGTWVDLGTVLSPLDQPNTHGTAQLR